MPGPAGFRALITLAWPIVLARSAQAVIGFCDAAMVAPLGEDALAATTAASTNTLALFILPIGVVFIVQSFAAQLAGRRDYVAARRYAGHGLTLAAIGMVIAVALAPVIGGVVEHLEFSPAVRGLMAQYIAIRLFAAGAVIGTEALGNWYGGLGDTRPAMVANLVAMVVNIFANWVLIFGNLGFPALGVEGAAIASVIASWIGFAAIGVHYLRDRGAAAIGRLERARESSPPAGPPEGELPPVALQSDGRRLREFTRMLRFGLPNGANWFLEFSAFLVFINFIVADLGTAAVAALMAVIQLNQVSFMPAFGLSSAGAILVGQAIGAREHDRVPGLVARTATVCAGWQGLIALLYVSIPAPLMGVFASDRARAHESGVVVVGATLLAISAAWQLFDSLAMSLSEALRAAGDTAWCLWARISLAWIVWLPLSYLTVGVLELGVIAATWCLVLYIALLMGVLLLRFRSGAWRRIDLAGGG